MNSYLCFECKSRVLKVDAIYDGHYYHKDCYQKVLDRKEFIEYVSRLFGLISPGPTIYSQRKVFMEKYGYTDREMIDVLRYVYEIKKAKIEGAKERIGIIPLAYEEAMAYYKGEREKQLDVANKMAKIIENQKTQVLYVKPSKPIVRNKQFIDPESIYEMEDEEW